MTTDQKTVSELDLDELLQRNDHILAGALSPHSLFLSSASYIISTRYEVNVRLRDYFDREGATTLTSAQQHQYTFCAHRHGGGWNRSILWKPNSKLLALNLDLGTVKRVSDSFMFKLPQELYKIPRGVIEIGMYNIKPTNGTQWGPETRKFSQDYCQAARYKNPVKFVYKGRVEGYPMGEVLLESGESLNSLLLRSGLGVHAPFLDKIYTMPDTMFP